MNKIRFEYETVRDKPIRLPEETTRDYQARLARERGNINIFNTRWRCYATPSRDGFIPAADLPLSKFIRQHKTELSMEWDCYVLDVLPRRGMSVRILCGVTMNEDWDYAVIGYMPGRDKLKKGELIHFVGRFIMAMPSDDDPVKLDFIQSGSDALRYKHLSIP